MKKKLVGLLLISLIATGCGKVPKLENGQESLISFKGHEISVDDFYEELKEQYGLSIMVSMADKYVLETTFKDYIEDAKKEAKESMDKLAENYESDKELLQAIQTYTGFATLDDYEDYIYLSNMKTHAAEVYAKDSITDKEIQKYYDDTLKNDIEISHILITPDVKDDMTDDEKKKAETDALNTANEIIKELKKAKGTDLEKTFGELAKKYSKDDATKDDNGSLGRVNVDTLGSTYSELVDKAYTLKDNTYYAKAIKSTLGYHIIFKSKSYEKAKLEDVKETIIDKLTDEKLTNDSSIQVNAIQHYRKNLDMKINDDKLASEFNTYIQNSLQYSLNS